MTKIIGAIKRSMKTFQEAKGWPNMNSISRWNRSRP